MNKSDNLARAIRTFEPAREPYRRKRAKLERVDSPLYERAKAKKKRGTTLMTVFAMFYVVVLCVALICGQSILAEASSTLREKTSELSAISSETTRLSLQLNSMTSLSNIENQATTRLGLSEPKQSQTQYIVVDRSNEVTRPEEDDSWWDKLVDLLESMMEKITG